MEICVTPISRYFLCDHYRHHPKYIGISLQLKSNDLLNKSLSTRKNSGNSTNYDDF